MDTIAQILIVLGYVICGLDLAATVWIIVYLVRMERDE
jgi:hypothetical protein